MGGDTFSGSLTVKGILLIGEIDAASVTNTGFMLLEGGSGSDHLPKTQRGWHVTDSMDWVVDKDIWFNIGMNADWIVGMNQTSDVGMNVSLNAGINIDNTAGANFSNTAGATYQETAGTVIIMAAPSILENS
jgi:hypothetical protein